VSTCFYSPTPSRALPFAIADRNTCGATLLPPHSIQPGYSSMPSQIPGQWTIAFAILHFPLLQAPPSPTPLRFHFWILTKNYFPARMRKNQLQIANSRLQIALPRDIAASCQFAICNSQLFRHLRRVRTVFSKQACRRKFAEFVADHVLSDKNGIKRFPVVYQKRVADKIRRHHRASRPGLDRLLDRRRVHLVDLFKKMRLDEGSFL